ncbi:hypothetical protein BaRGS_00032938 [Batillaria attramentaria]|uniref:Uncharacterized protein n=1 Tax=Batillaria attramentaria TaxID=370345 RepID=A0ABD0JL97_9CAEN
MNSKRQPSTAKDSQAQQKTAITDRDSTAMHSKRQPGTAKDSQEQQKTAITDRDSQAQQKTAKHSHYR